MGVRCCAQLSSQVKLQGPVPETAYVGVIDGGLVLCPAALPGEASVSCAWSRSSGGGPAGCHSGHSMESPWTLSGHHRGHYSGHCSNAANSKICRSQLVINIIELFY